MQDDAAELAPFLERIAAKKDEVLALVDQIPDMKPQRRSDARTYLGEFFSTASNPGKASARSSTTAVKAVGMKGAGLRAQGSGLGLAAHGIR